MQWLLVSYFLIQVAKTYIAHTSGTVREVTGGADKSTNLDADYKYSGLW